MENIICMEIGVNKKRIFLSGVSALMSATVSFGANASFYNSNQTSIFSGVLSAYSRCFSLSSYNHRGIMKGGCASRVLYGNVGVYNKGGNRGRGIVNNFFNKGHYRKKSNRNIYEQSRLLDIDISMADSDWEKLRLEGPQVSEWSFGCEFSGYNNYSSTVKVNGKEVTDVAVKKRGRIGAVTVLKPALSISYNVGDGNEERTFLGNTQIGLTNNRQDGATIRSCLALSAFDSLGLPTQQCNFAEVTAQGEELGIYSNVEPVKSPFLLREFGGDSGNLYSAKRAGDFNPSQLPLLSLETNKELNDRTDLSQVLEAMNAPDDEVWDALNEFINMDQFLTFSAAESLIGHKNGYNGFQNNTFIYSNPMDNDRFHFFPTGTDQTFATTYHLTTQTAPASVYLGSELMQRLWETPGFQERYDDRMRELLDHYWDERSLKRQARQMARFISADLTEVEKIYDFIDNRRANIEAELGTVRIWERPLMADVTGCPEPTAFSGSFDIQWNQDFQDQGSMSIDVQEIDGTLNSIQGNGYGSFDDRGDGVISNNIRLFGSNAQGEDFLLLLAVNPLLWEEGELAFHSAETIGAFFKLQESGPPVRLGLTTDGGMFFEELSTEDGGRIKGTFTAFYVEPNN